MDALRSRAALTLRAGGRAGAKLTEIARAISKVLFTTGGSDAIEVAIKIAARRDRPVQDAVFWDAFHGAGSAHPRSRRGAFPLGGVGPLMPGAEHVAPMRDTAALWHATLRERGRLRRMIDMCSSARATSRFIGRTDGAVPEYPPPGSGGACARCDRHGTLLDLRRNPDRLGKTGKMCLPA